MLSLRVVQSAFASTPPTIAPQVQGGEAERSGRSPGLRLLTSSLICISMPRVLHVDLVEQTDVALQLRLWRDNLNSALTRPLALAEIAGLVQMAEANYDGPAQPRLQEVGSRLFRWLDGGERWLSAEIEEAANQTDVLVLSIDSSSRLAHLPWEALHDGAGFLVHAANPPVLPVRRRGIRSPAHVPSNRPLRALLMVGSPSDITPVLDFEWEEHLISEAVRRWAMDLRVEESGCLDDLGRMLQTCGPGFFDLLHLSGHASHSADGTPVFLLEDGDGRCMEASVPDIAATLPYRPALFFVSGCHTGGRPRAGEVRSMAEQLVGCGFPAVLGWGRDVQDIEATNAERYLYQKLAAGAPLPLALASVHARLRNDGAEDWHLLRLFCAGDPPASLVTPLLTPGRTRRPARSPDEFLDPLTRRVRVAGQGEFRGRRRLLQEGVRWLRQPEDGRVGLLVWGPQGCGKSSVAARLCDRLYGEFQRVVVTGRMDELALLDAWAPELPDPIRSVLRGSSGELRYRLQSTLLSVGEAGLCAPLFVLDDIGQDLQPGVAGDRLLPPPAAQVLGALLAALQHTGMGRVLVTGRGPLPDPFAEFVHNAEVLPLEAPSFGL